MNQYYNSKYPLAFRQNYAMERDYLWSCLQRHLSEGFTRQHFPKFMNTFSVIIVKLINCFDLSRPQAQLITSVCVSLIFDDSL